MQAQVQKNWPAIEMNTTRPAVCAVRAWLKIPNTLPPDVVVSSPTDCTANRKVSRRIQPPIAEYRIDCQMPRAAESAASLVSSERCTEASYPVIVYWVRMPDRGST